MELSISGNLCEIRIAEATYELRTNEGESLADMDSIIIGSSEVLGLADSTIRAIRQAPIHGGNPPWVRFRQDQLNDLPDGAKRLVVLAKDGLSMGLSENLEEGMPISIQMQPTATVIATVSSEVGLPLEGLRIEMGSIDSSTVHADAIQDGCAEFKWVASGSYEITANAPLHEAVVQSVLLVPGQTAKLEMLLPLSDISRAIAGQVHSETGQYDLPCEISLWVPGDLVASKTASVSWRDINGEIVGKFAFANLPQADYVCTIMAQDFYEWKFPSTVHTGQIGVEFRCMDHVAVSDYGFHILDAADGAVVHDVELRCRYVGTDGNHKEFLRIIPSDVPCIQRFPSELPLSWELRKTNYRSISGSKSDMREVRLEGGTSWRCATVTLERLQ